MAVTSSPAVRPECATHSPSAGSSRPPPKNTTSSPRATAASPMSTTHTSMATRPTTGCRAPPMRDRDAVTEPADDALSVPARHERDARVCGRAMGEAVRDAFARSQRLGEQHGAGETHDGRCRSIPEDRTRRRGRVSGVPTLLDAPCLRTSGRAGRGRGRPRTNASTPRSRSVSSDRNELRAPTHPDADRRR